MPKKTPPDCSRKDDKGKSTDIQAKISVVKGVIIACAEDRAAGAKPCFTRFKKQVQYYTERNANSLSVSEVVDQVLAQNQNSRYNTFSDYFDLPNDTSRPPVAKILRHAIIDHYVNMNTIPTLSTLSDYFRDAGYVDYSFNSIKQNLKKAGYMWKRITGTPKTILIENPAQVYKRVNYLESIKQYRNRGLHIVYVDEKNMNNVYSDYVSLVTDSVKQHCLAVSTLLGVIGSKIFEEKINVVTQVNVIPLLDDWIVTSIVPHLSTSSVLVLEEKPKHKERSTVMPTINSSKQDMLTWLALNNIPHNTDYHRAELFELIKRSKRNCPTKIYKLDEILNAHGHKVLRRPSETIGLDIFEPIWTQILQVSENQATAETLEDIEKSAKSVLSLLDINNWKDFEYKIVTKENETYAEDKAVELTIDKLLTLAKYEPLSRHRFEHCEEGIDETELAKILQL